MQLDNAPSDFIFVIDKIPIGRRQEDKKQLTASLPTVNPTLYLRPITLSGSMNPVVTGTTSPRATVTAGAEDTPTAPAAPEAPSAPSAPSAPDDLGVVTARVGGGGGSVRVTTREQAGANRGDLFASIRAGQTLKAVKDMPQRQKTIAPGAGASGGGGLNSLLANALATRRGQVEDDSYAGGRARSDSWDED